jgi:hypothetical protein
MVTSRPLANAGVFLYNSLGNYNKRQRATMVDGWFFV